MRKELFYKTYRIGKEIKALLWVPVRFFRLKSIVEKPTYYPELPRKSKTERWLDNIWFLFHDKMQNNYYTSYGLDVKSFRNKKDYILQREFINARNNGNQKLKLTISGDYNYIVLLRDKYLFANYLSSVIGEAYIVPTVALITQGVAYIAKEKEWRDPVVLLIEGSKFVYKTVDGECADGIMLVEVKNGKVFVNGKSCTPDTFIRSFTKNRYLVQEVVEQHVALRAFGTKSVNTIRIVTIKGRTGAINLFAAFLRLGASADCFVDNRAVGGLGVGINLDSGTLMKYGFPHDAYGVKMDEHPLSHIKFDGYRLPYWNETINLVIKAHQQFYDIQSIGWDVVLTDHGPVLLEGNDDWEIGGPQDTSGGLRKRWIELINA